MDVKEYEAIKGKVTTLKDKQSRLQGNLEGYMKQLSDLGVATVDGAQTLLTELNAQVTENEALQDELFGDLKGCHSWQFV